MKHTKDSEREAILETEMEIFEALRERATEFKISTAAGFDYVMRRADRKEFRIFALDVARPGLGWRFGFEIIWPPRQRELL